MQFLSKSKEFDVCGTQAGKVLFFLDFVSVSERGHSRDVCLGTSDGTQRRVEIEHIYNLLKNPCVKKDPAVFETEESGQLHRIGNAY